MQDAELVEYFSESCTMSKSVEEYGDRKSCAITTAQRLAQFLGDERIKDKGLACNYIIAACALCCLHCALPARFCLRHLSLCCAWLLVSCCDVANSTAAGVSALLQCGCQPLHCIVHAETAPPQRAQLCPSTNTSTAHSTHQATARLTVQSLCRKPQGTPTSARAVPVIIFSAEPAVARGFLRRWTGEAASGPPHTAPDVREFLDWGYYKERLGSAIQKIITIPAAYQARCLCGLVG